MATAPQVFDGVTWQEVTPPNLRPSEIPIKPAPALDGSIFVNLAHLKDEARCAQTIQRLFDNAEDKASVFIGLVEHNENNHGRDCLAMYCENAGAGGDKNKHPKTCPRYSQIESLAVFDLGAKGPTVSRALGRKLLGNQEYCMQIDSHSDFVKNWDTVAKSEWKATNNEYGVISAKPANVNEKADYGVGGSKEASVSRSCHVEFNNARLPMFGDATEARNLKEPLLGHGWSAAFSFAKCHLEEAVPYDYFLPQIFQGEEFPRYARMWTRGYDVYTPTRNIVFHDYSQPAAKWKDSQLQRKRAQKRIRTLLQMSEGDLTEKACANLNLYGLGKRRSLEDFYTFLGFDARKHNGGGSVADCANQMWIPYPASTSALENLYTDEADSEMHINPIMPLRTHPVLLFNADAGHLTSKTVKPKGIHELPRVHVPLTLAQEAHVAQEVLQKMEKQLVDRAEESSAPVKMLVGLWVFGIAVWVFVFSKSRNKSVHAHGRARRNARKMLNGHKDM